MNGAIEKSEKKMKYFPAPCNIYRSKENVVLLLEMAGVGKDSLEIRVEGNKLIIDGMKSTPKPQGSYKVREIREGYYHQEYTIDDTIDRENIDASIRNGLAKITLSLKESEKPKMIKVKVK